MPGNATKDAVFFAFPCNPPGIAHEALVESQGYFMIMNVVSTTSSHANPVTVELASLKQEWLEPYRDYPSYMLAHDTPQQAAQFIVGYVCGHVRFSPNIDLLEGQPLSEYRVHAARLASIRHGIASIMGCKFNQCRVGVTFDETFTDEGQFVRATDAIAAERVGNCGELAWVAARALKEFGCPHGISVMQASGTLSDGREIGHSLVKIDDGKDPWYADPFFHLMNEPLRRKYIPDPGYMPYWPLHRADGVANFLHQMYVTTRPSDTYQIDILPLSEMFAKDADDKPRHSLTDLSTLFTVDKSANGKITISFMWR